MLIDVDDVDQQKHPTSGGGATPDKTTLIWFEVMLQSVFTFSEPLARGNMPEDFATEAPFAWLALNTKQTLAIRSHGDGAGWKSLLDDKRTHEHPVLEHPINFAGVCCCIGQWGDVFSMIHALQSLLQDISMLFHFQLRDRRRPENLVLNFDQVWCMNFRPRKRNLQRRRARNPRPTGMDPQLANIYVTRHFYIFLLIFLHAWHPLGSIFLKHSIIP